MKCAALLMMLVALTFPVQAFGQTADVVMEEVAEDMDQQKAVDMIAKDVPNDRISLFWDGNAFSEVEDVLDDSSIMDGRGGEYACNRMKMKLMTVYLVESENGLNEDCVLQDDDRCFTAENESRFAHIAYSGQTWEQVQQVHDQQIASGLAVAEAPEWLEQGIAEKTVLETFKGNKMAGIRYYIPMSDGTVVTCEYGGIGNYADILAEAEIMVQRTVKYH